MKKNKNSYVCMWQGQKTIVMVWAQRSKNIVIVRTQSSKKHCRVWVQGSKKHLWFSVEESESIGTFLKLFEVDAF